MNPKTLRILYMDGREEEFFVGAEALVSQTKNGDIVWEGGDGSYLQRGTKRVFPTKNVRTWMVEPR